MQFIYESQAFHADFHRGKGFPTEGMELMANIAHKYKIPVTWLTNGRGAVDAADKFSEFHKKYGDQVSLWLMPHQEYKRDQYKTVMSWKREDIRKFVQEELDQAKEALPWAKFDTVGFFFRNNLVLDVLSEMDFIAVYGACWYQFLTDSVDDVGIPYGCYYMDKQNFKRPAQTEVSLNLDERNQPLISNEWLTHDLNKCSNYKKTASVFTTDPNDVNNNGVCYPGETQYWFELFRQHYRNSLLNEFYPFILHQESHEMLNNASFQLYPKKKVEECAAILDALLEFVTSPENHFDVDFTTNPTAMRYYRTHYSKSPAMISTFDDVEIATERFQARRLEQLQKIKWSPKKIMKLRAENKTRGLVGGPFPPTIVYYDLDCQLFFVKPQSWPVELRNYHRKEAETIKNMTRNSEIFMEKEIPLPVWKMISNRELEIKIGSKPQNAERFPYGLVLWNPERLFNGQPYQKWMELRQRFQDSNGVPISDQAEVVRKIFTIDGPIENIRLSTYWDKFPSQVGGENAILLRLNLTDKETIVKISPK